VVVICLIEIFGFLICYPLTMHLPAVRGFSFLARNQLNFAH